MTQMLTLSTVSLPNYLWTSTPQGSLQFLTSILFLAIEIFRCSRPGLVVPEGTFVPYNAQATLHSKEVPKCTEHRGHLIDDCTEVSIHPSSRQRTFSIFAFNQAFFGLLLPITVHGRVSDIWRSYFSQVSFFLFRCDGITYHLPLSVG